MCSGIREDKYAMIAIDDAGFGPCITRQPRVADRIDVARTHVLAHGEKRCHRDRPPRRRADQGGGFCVGGGHRRRCLGRAEGGLSALDFLARDETGLDRDSGQSYEASTYQSIANEQVLIIPMIETQEAIDNIDAILDVPGISGIYIGPSDLGFSLGLKPVLDREEPEIFPIYEKLVKATGKRGQFAGIHNASGAYAARMIAMGFRFVTIANDSGLMARAAREQIAITRKSAGDVAS
jgi:hypothetical protein